MAKAGFSFEIKTSLDHLFTQERNAIIAFPFRMGTVVLEYPIGNVKEACFFLRKY
jgi:hypothetical protein